MCEKFLWELDGWVLDIFLIYYINLVDNIRKVDMFYLLELGFWVENYLVFCY